MSRIDWSYVQADADAILADGFEALKAAPCVKAAQVRDETPCNYLVSLKGEPRHVGEADNAQARLRREFREASSAFYKSYRKKAGAHAALAEFDVRVMRTALGRKELEEFGILQLAAKPKGRESQKHDDTGLWEVVQAQRDRLLDDGVAALMACKPKNWFDCQPSTGPGVYAVIRDGRLIHIGESADLAERHETHSDHTCFSALRRNIGTEMFRYELQDAGGRRRSFTDDQDWKVTRFMAACDAVFMPVALGRYELQERLLATLSPALARKGSSHQSGQKNAEPAA